MSVTVDDLVADVRLHSGLRSNPLISDQKIVDLLNAAQFKLRDIFIASLSHWFRKRYRFTLAGGAGTGSELDLTLIPDLQMDQYLNRNPDSVNPEPVTKLGSLAERTFGNGIPPGWVGGRKYDCDGDVLTVYPFNNSAGDYELTYTPQAEKLAFTKTVNFNIAPSDTPSVPPPGGLLGNGAWLLANANEAEATDIPTSGFDLVLTFTSGPPDNTPFSGTYPVVDVGLPPSFGSPTFACDNLVSTVGFTNPAAGTGTYTYQPAGTRIDLPQILTPWAHYCVLDASIAVRSIRRQPTEDLERALASEEKRAITMAKRRSEGVKQAPMTHNRIRRRGYNYGSAQ